MNAYPIYANTMFINRIIKSDQFAFSKCFLDLCEEQIIDNNN